MAAASRGGGVVVGVGDPSSPSARGMAAAAGEEEAGGGKVKLLCNFGGRIVPKQPDGSLRYASGQTRLISVPRAASFAELMRKVEAVDDGGGGGGGVLVKYQLPGEDLDSLISVSCPEDYENMLDEYDKLAAATPDGSAKLRVFLFPASGGSEPATSGSGSHLAAAAAAAGAVAVDESGQRYIDAINCVSAEAVAAMRRKESVASAGSSAHNSGASASEYGGGGGAADGMSPRFVPPPHSVPPEYLYSGGSHYHGAFPESLGFSVVTTSAPAMGIPAQNPVLIRTEAQPLQPHQVASYVPPPHQPPQAACYAPHQQPQIAAYAPPQPQPQQPQVAQYMPQSYREPHQVQYINSQQFGHQGVPQSVNMVPVQGSQYMPNIQVTNSMPASAAAQGSNLKPASAVTEPVLENIHFTRPQQGTGDPNYRVMQPLSQFPPLPHVHMQTGDAPRYGVQPVVTSTMSTPVAISSVTMPSVTYDDCAMCHNGLPHSHLDSTVQEQANPRAVNNLGPRANTGIPVQAAPSPNTGLFVHSPTVNLPASIPPAANVVFVGQQKHSYEPQPSHVPMNGIVSGLQGVDTNALKSSNHQIVDPHREYNHEFSHDYARGISAQMQGVHLGPIAPQEFNVQGKPVVPHGAMGDGGVEQPPMNIDSGNIYRSQVGGYHMGITNAFSASEDMRHTEQPPHAFDLGAQNVHSNISQQPNMSSNIGVPVEPPVSSERFVVRPAYSGVQVRVEHPPLHPGEMLTPLVSAPPNGSSPYPLHATAGSDRVEAKREPAYTESLFSNQDPWNAVGNASIVPPRPNKLAKEPVVSGDHYVEGHVPAINNSSTVTTLLEEGHLPFIQNHAFKDIYPEPSQMSKGFGEESIKRQLQAVAEGVAASVLQSTSLEKPTVLSGNLVDAHGTVVDPKTEDVVNNQSDKTSQGGQVLDDIDNLQIIKNIDLEELRELGSGTFGTVFHGKWRGSDVAIKRINDRCFAGKASEQERMRTDFWNEACKLASLHHPNVVAFYGVVLDGPGGSVATVTEYMANGSLRQALQRNEKIFDRRRRLLIAMDVAFGMEYLHGKNIVHFDLKSDNLLVNLRDPQRPICKVGDLGLSKVKRQTLISGGVRGTLPWMAPELLNGSSSLVSEKVDVFSFGIVMWELLTGDEPYAELHYGAIIGGIVNNTLRPPVPDVCDPQWRSLMEQCWSSEPSERPSFMDVVKRLRAMAASPARAQPQK